MTPTRFAAFVVAAASFPSMETRRASVRTIVFAIVLGFAMNSVVGLSCKAGEPNAVVESVLVKWEEAFKKCRTWDAKMTVLHYDRVFAGNEPTTRQGRFYYEAQRQTGNVSTLHSNSATARSLSRPGPGRRRRGSKRST
jgi:hypothetical protein